MLNIEEKIYCAGGCGIILAKPKIFPMGSYCKIYCCSCCPDKKRFPCQKEVRDGTFFRISKVK